MDFQELSIPGVWVITAPLIGDERGFFRRSFCTEEFRQHGLEPQVLQGNISVNPTKGTLRGFHFQLPPHEEAKTLTCVSGSIFNVVLDIRPKSPTFLKWEIVELDAVACKSIYVPKGCANAYLTTNDNTIIHYYMSDLYAPGAAGGLRYNDPVLGVPWPSPPVLISQKDLTYPDLDTSLFLGAGLV